MLYYQKSKCKYYMSIKKYEMNVKENEIWTEIYFK